MYRPPPIYKAKTPTRPAPKAHGGGGGFKPVPVTPPRSYVGGRAGSQPVSNLQHKPDTGIAHTVGHALSHGLLGKTIGTHGAIGGLEDLAQSVNPVAIAKSLKHNLTTSPYQRGANKGLTLEQANKRGISAGIIGKFGKENLPEEVKGAVERANAKAAEPIHEAAPEELAQKALGPMRSKRAEQAKLYKEERGKRISQREAEFEKAGGGLAGFRASIEPLKGELPKVAFNNLREGKLTREGIDSLINQVHQHPELSDFEKVHAMKGLRAAFEEGRVPQKSQITLLQKVFGQDATDALVRHFHLGQTVMDALQIPRSVMASFDVSAPFRQGLIVAAGHPRIFAKNFGPMFKYLVHEKSYQNVLDEIHSRPNADLYQQAGVKFTELRGKTSKNREEQFSSDMAEHIPGLGHIIRGSGRAYTGFLDKTRADVFDSMLETARKKGVNVENQKFLRSLGHYTSSATGRGSLGPAESWAPALNTVFFSPRLIASRINFLDPTWYFRLDPFVRRQALKSIASLGAGSALALGLAGQYTRAKIVTNPLNADFAKLRIGNTRIDLLGGFQQYVRLVSQLEQGKIISSTTGKELNLGHGYGQLSRWDILERFASGKFSPPASFVYDFFKGTNFAGQPFNVKKELLSRIIPLVAQDAMDLQNQKHNLALTALGYAVSSTGVGIQTYSPKSKTKSKSAKAKAKSKSKGGSGAAPVYGGGSSGGSSGGPPIYGGG